jgi:hypothetical protein
MAIAGQICIFTNDQITIEELAQKPASQPSGESASQQVKG